MYMIWWFVYHMAVCVLMYTIWLSLYDDKDMQGYELNI